MAAAEKLAKLKNEGNRAFVVHKNWSEAIKKYSEALEIDLKSKGKVKLEEDRKALQLERSKVYANRAECYIREGKFEEGLSDCESALAIDPKYVKALFRKAKCLDKLGKTSKAVETLQNSLKVSRNANSEKLLEKLLQKNKKTFMSRDDAMKIAKFSKLNLHKQRLELDIKDLKEEVVNISDGLEDLEVCIDDDSALLMIGDVFIPTEDDQVEDYCQARRAKLQGMIEDKSKKLNVLLGELDGLRVGLKDKLGDSVNLEEN